MAAPGTIRTGAGGGTGDGIWSTDASLDSPTGIASDLAGNIYIADTVHNTIRRIDRNGIITTIAGNGLRGYSGNGGPAVQASLNRPEGITVDAGGNLFISDTMNNRIRKVDASGVITTVAGSGIAAYSGDGLQATLASLSAPEGLAMTPDGELLIADAGNHVVRRIDRSGSISTMAGIGIAGIGLDNVPAKASLLDHPESLAVATGGAVFIADTNNHRIRKVLIDGTITTVAGIGSAGNSGDGGLATSAALNYPESIAITGQRLFVGDSHNRKIRVIEDGIITTVAGSGERGWSGDQGPAKDAKMSAIPGLVVLDDGSLVFADPGNHRIRQVTPDGIIRNIAGNGATRFLGDGLLASSAVLNRPSDVAALSNGDLLIADTHQHRIRRVSASDGVISTFAGIGRSAFSGDGGPAVWASLSFPKGLAVAQDGSVYVTEEGNKRVRRIDVSGNITTVAGGGSSYASSIPATTARLESPFGMDLDAAGNLFLADAASNRIVKIDPAGLLTVVAGGVGGYGGDGGSAAHALLNAPTDVDADTDGSLYVADTRNHRIRKIDPEGIITTVAGDGTQCFYGDGGQARHACLSWPNAVLATSEGFIISDSSNNRIRSVGGDGIIRTIAGNGYWGFGGDGLTGTSAALKWPSGIQVNSEGNLLIADSWNGRVRMLEAGW